MGKRLFVTAALSMILLGGCAAGMGGPRLPKLMGPADEVDLSCQLRRETGQSEGTWECTGNLSGRYRMEEVF